MKIVHDIAEMQAVARRERAGGRCIGFVPTMGYLHAGHLELVRQARAGSDFVVVSIFVNPTQFNRRDDFEAYPRDDAHDRELVERAGVDVLFMPRAEDVYGEGAATSVHVGGLTDGLCGPGRPGHFDGVATVVAALFNMVGPDRAWFGEKDYQQLQVVRRMARDLHFAVEVVGVPTVREADGLAMSSRNARLTAEQRAIAGTIYRALVAAGAAFRRGERQAARLVEVVRSELEQQPELRLEYVEVVDGGSVAPVVAATEECVVAVAAWLGEVRLIDNLPLARVRAANSISGASTVRHLSGGITPDA